MPKTLHNIYIIHVSVLSIFVCYIYRYVLFSLLIPPPLHKHIISQLSNIHRFYCQLWFVILLLHNFFALNTTDDICTLELYATFIDHHSNFGNFLIDTLLTTKIDLLLERRSTTATKTTMRPVVLMWLLCVVCCFFYIEVHEYR